MIILKLKENMRFNKLIKKSCNKMSFGDPLKETKHYQLPFLESVFGSSTRVIYIYIDAIVTGVICVVCFFL